MDKLPTAMDTVKTPKDASDEQEAHVAKAIENAGGRDLNLAVASKTIDKPAAVVPDNGQSSAMGVQPSVESQRNPLQGAGPLSKATEGP
jgi:hypothetical protein